MPTQLTSLLKTKLPIIQAPMAGSQGWEMAASVANVGGLGSIPCALFSVEQIEEQVTQFKKATSNPFNLNFFAHTVETPVEAREKIWRETLKPYFDEMGLDQSSITQGPVRASFGEEHCALVEKLRPDVVSFHFGLPDKALVERVKASGAKVISSATTLQEGVWLAERGVDAIIAQGREAGGHRGMFLETDPTRQIGTYFLLPTLLAELDLPIIAAGGVSSRETLRAAFDMGANGVQVGTAYLFARESKITALHLAALLDSEHRITAITNLFTGKPARGIINRLMAEIGPLSDKVPVFPNAGNALAPLKKAAEQQEKIDFSSTWSGEGAALTIRMFAKLGLLQKIENGERPTAGEITNALASALN